MADSLIFKGQKTVINQSGDELKLAWPKRGGDTWQVKKWWGGRASTVYLTCAKFLVTTSGGTIHLVVPCDQDSVELKILHDGDGGFTFPDWIGIERIGVFTESGELIKQYILPGNYTLPVVEEAGTGELPQPEPEPPVVVAPFADRVAAANFSYAVTVANGVYELNGVPIAGVTGSVGDVFHFDLSDASLSGHPFKIYTDPGRTTEITVGVEQEGTDLLFTPPIAGTFSYQCPNHANMGGDLTVN